MSLSKLRELAAKEGVENSQTLDKKVLVYRILTLRLKKKYPDEPPAKLRELAKKEGMQNYGGLSRDDLIYWPTWQRHHVHESDFADRAR